MVVAWLLEAIWFWIKLHVRAAKWLVSKALETDAGTHALAFLVGLLTLSFVIGWDYAIHLWEFLFWAWPLLVVGYITFRLRQYLIPLAPSTGRVKYEVGRIDWRALVEPYWPAWLRRPRLNLQQRLMQRASAQVEDGVQVDRVLKRSENAPPTPRLNPATSIMVLGQTGLGKSSFAKRYLQEWDPNQATIAHALSERGDYNELARFFEAEGRDVEILSSRNSTVRWNPFLDYDPDWADMQTLATGLFDAEVHVDTGWTANAVTLLKCALMVCYYEQANDPDVPNPDLAQLGDTLTMGEDGLDTVDTILRKAERIPNSDRAVYTLKNARQDAQSAAYGTMMSNLQKLLSSDLFDRSITMMPLRDYLANPGETVLVLDNIRQDDFARPFWRFFIQSAVDFAGSTAGTQQFVLDEVDKLPRISNLGHLASAGRSAGVTGLLVVQDANQLRRVYGEEVSTSIWSNSPNRVCFRAGDDVTIDLVLSSIGAGELESRSVRRTRSLTHADDRTSTDHRDRLPLSQREMTSLGPGEALIQSGKHWWLADTTEPDLQSDEEALAEEVWAPQEQPDGHSERETADG